MAPNEAENDVDVSLGLASARKEQLHPIAILARTPLAAAEGVNLEMSFFAL